MEVLSLNDYPYNFINNIIPENTSAHHHQPPPNSDTDWLYLRTPYISDAVDRKITNVFKDEGFPVRVVHRSTSLRQALAPSQRENTNCATAIHGLCFRKNVVHLRSLQPVNDTIMKKKSNDK